MTDVVEEFRRLLAQAEGDRGTAIETLLGLMPPANAGHLRLCAIPHEFDLDVLRLIAPELDATTAASRYEEFARLSCVVSLPAGLALHDSTRAELFADWLRPEHSARFREVSARLVSHYERLAAHDRTSIADAMRARRMFHLVGVDQNIGFAEFEGMSRKARREYRWTACANYLRLIDEYASILSPERRAWLVYHRAKLALDLHHWDQADSLLRELVADQSAPQALAVKAHLRLGYLEGERERFADAISHYQHALDLVVVSPPDAVKVYHVLRSLGEAHRDSNDYARAEELLNESLRSAHAAADGAAIADVYNSLGTLHWKRHEISEAANAYRASLAFLERTGRAFQSAQVYNNLGMVYCEERSFAFAEQAYQRSLSIKRDAGDTLGQARTLLNLVQVYSRRGDSDRAIAACLEAIGLFGVINHLLGRASATRMMARLKLAQGAEADAVRHLEEAAELYAHCKRDDDVASVRAEIAALQGRVGVPWWAWAAVIVCTLLVAVAIIIVFIVR